MARKDYYDWRGIAMLTQQLGELFEPSKARLMSQQHEHEMHMLMAKKAWETQSEELKLKKIEYNGLQDDIAAAEQTLMERDLPELVKAATKDGANPEQAADILEKTSGKTLGGLNDMARNYEEMIRNDEATLSNMVGYNAHAIVGEKWRKGTMNKKDRTGVMTDYYKEANVDGIPELSYEEGQNMIKSYIKDNFTTDKDGVEMTFGTGDQTEMFMVKPEAVAWRAGYESGTGTGTGRGKAEKDIITSQNDRVKAVIDSQKGKTPLNMTDEELKKMWQFNKNRIEKIDSAGKARGQEYGLGVYLELGLGGQFTVTEVAMNQGYKEDDVLKYAVSYTQMTKAASELSARRIELPGAPVNMAKYNDQIIQDFSHYGTHPDSLLPQILASGKSDVSSAMSSYNDFLTKLDKLSPEDRRKGVETYLDWLKAK